MDTFWQDVDRHPAPREHRGSHVRTSPTTDAAGPGGPGYFIVLISTLRYQTWSP